ncbi:hypothetical protein RB201_38110 [Streptomyces sp. S1A(2023)]
MILPPRLVPLLEQFDFACERLLTRLAGPVMDSGNGVDIVWWVNQEVLHHGAEIALLRDLYRARRS